MVVVIAVWRCWWCSGGKGRRTDGPAEDADGAGELDSVRVDVGLGGGLADQGADRIMGEQVAVDLLADHGRAFGPQHFGGSTQMRFELVVAGLVPSAAGMPGPGRARSAGR